jgi:hypothetical protein
MAAVDGGVIMFLIYLLTVVLLMIPFVGLLMLLEAAAYHRARERPRALPRVPSHAPESPRKRNLFALPDFLDVR